jgi:hypothetical protein
MPDPAAEVKQATLDYKAALDDIAQTHDALASQLAGLANEVERQRQPALADAIQQAGHHHRASSIKYRALAASLKVSD